MKVDISNTSTTLIVNTYEGFYTSDKTHLNEAIHKKYSNNNLLDILRSVAKGINAQILTESTHNFDPFGDSSALLIQANVELANSGTLHLKESHITYHTYLETRVENFFIIRLEIHICSCTKANVFDSLEYIMNSSNTYFKNFLPEIISLDCLRRGHDIDLNENFLKTFTFDYYSDSANKYIKIIDVDSVKSTGSNHLHYLLQKEQLNKKLSDLYNNLKEKDVDNYYKKLREKYCSYI